MGRCSVADPGVLHSVVRAALLARLVSLLPVAVTLPKATWWSILGPAVIGVIGLILMLSTKWRGLVSERPALILGDTALIAVVAAGTGASHPFIATFMTSALLVGLWLGIRIGVIVLDALLILYLLVLAPQLGNEPTTGMLVPFVLITLWWLGWAVQRADLATRAVQHELNRQAASTATFLERSRVARDMHDTFAKTLQAMSLTAAALPSTLQRDPERGLACAADIQSMSAAAVREARDLLRELRQAPAAESFPNLISELCQEWAQTNEARLVTDLDETVDTSDPELRKQVTMVLREALENIRRHANASIVTVVLRQEGQTVILAVQDDGCGVTDSRLQDAESQGHFGRRGMGERMALVGGTLEFTSGPARGTRVILRAPLTPRRKGAAA